MAGSSENGSYCASASPVYEIQRVQEFEELAWIKKSNSCQQSNEI